MESLFIGIYRYFKTHRKVFWPVFLSIVVLIAFGASRVKIEEDITQFFPDDERVEKLNYVFRNSRFAERLVMMVSVEDSLNSPQPDSLTAFAEELVGKIDSTLKPWVSEIHSQVDDSQVLQMIGLIQTHLPIFLEEADYETIDSIAKPSVVKATLESNYRQLISPSGIVTKNIIVNDPLGFSFIALKKLQDLQFDENIDVYNNYLVSKDHRHLIFFVQPTYPPSNTGENIELIRGLDRIIAETAPAFPKLKASYFGGTAVAVGNAQQLQRDTILTISLMVVLLAVFLIGFFRKKRTPFFILIPVVFGALFSLSCVYLVQGSISIIAIAAGSIILGIAINYSLHFLAHLKHTRDIEAVIRDLVKPMTLGSTTTVLAFLCLQFVNAAVLRDLGLFAAFSLVGAALCSLIFLPQLISLRFMSDHHSWIERVSASTLTSHRYVILFIFLITPVFLFFAGKVSFNEDIGQLNFMSDETRTSQQRLERINNVSLTSVYIISEGDNLETALRKNERTFGTLQTLQDLGEIQKFSSVSAFLISDSLQQVRIQRWEQFWQGRSDQLVARVRSEGGKLNFSAKVFANFESLLTNPYKPDTTIWQNFRDVFFENYLIQKDGRTTVISLANVDPARKDLVYKHLAATPSHAFDRQMITNVFAEYVYSDFNFIVTFTSILVFTFLLISYGRIELAFITFIPMLITWVWILGIMALIGIEFNIVNVMISTFIFGLGDDYSIFIMDGLQQEYKLKRRNLPSIRTSILLSALTTISGLGVLIFAEHPALRSIAGISIIGIVCVFLMSQTLEPFLFRWLITNRASKGLRPMTLFGIGKTIFTYGFFVFGSFFLTITGLILKVVPFAKSHVRLAYHRLLSFFTGSLIRLAPQLKLLIQGRDEETFSKPSVIISNHSSFLDILLTTMLYPKLILLTNKWVWNSPVFGGVVRLADYYPVMEGAEDSVEKVKARLAEGYSIVVFPEGKRSEDGSISRFHKGAFFMAEKLNLPIQPLLIHGAAEAIPKSTIYLNAGQLTLKFLPKIAPEDGEFGGNYTERTKSITRYFRNEFSALISEQESPQYFRHRLIANYIYKGPVLEWYTRIKLRLENYYQVFHELIPGNASVLDLGCGYGYLPYMLSFLSAHRTIVGVDYDEEKIETARNCFSKTDRVHFRCADVVTYQPEEADVIVIADVLHYLSPEDQEKVVINAIIALPPGGKLIIRDGNADLKKRHRGTEITEMFSVRLLKFNKSAGGLHFISGETINRLAGGLNCSVKVIDDTKFTSNVIFVVQKQNSIDK